MRRSAVHCTLQAERVVRNVHAAVRACHMPAALRCLRAEPDAHRLEKLKRSFGGAPSYGSAGTKLYAHMLSSHICAGVGGSSMPASLLG